MAFMGGFSAGTYLLRHFETSLGREQLQDKQSRPQNQSIPHPRVRRTESAPEMFTCALCLERLAGPAPKALGPRSFCADCINDGILPQFHAALKYEGSYPVTLGSSITLEPADFIEFLPGGDVSAVDLLTQWQKKVREYETPYKSRVYCAHRGCGTFLCVKPKDEVNYSLLCAQCREPTCVGCRAAVSYVSPAHVCPSAEDADEATRNVYAGLKRGKDYQICPNETCSAPIELKTGCNHITCDAPSCRTQFCFICGERVGGPDVDGDGSGHWNLGKSCPRYNHPDDLNPSYDDPQVLDQVHVQFELEDHDDAVARATALLEDDSGGFDLLFDEIGREAYNGLIEGAVSLMNDLPPLPDIRGLTEAQQLAAETAMADELESTPIGRLMVQQQHELDAMIDAAETRVAEDEPMALEGQRLFGLRHPQAAAQTAFLRPAIDMMNALRSNLNLYVYRLRLRLGMERFESRHDSLEAAWGAHQAQIFSHFRRFYEILVPYATVAEIRFEGAQRVLEGAHENEDTFVRREVEIMRERWAEGRARESEMNEVDERIAELRTEVILQGLVGFERRAAELAEMRENLAGRRFDPVGTAIGLWDPAETAAVRLWTTDADARAAEVQRLNDFLAEEVGQLHDLRVNLQGPAEVDVSPADTMNGDGRAEEPQMFGVITAAGEELLQLPGVASERRGDGGERGSEAQTAREAMLQDLGDLPTLEEAQQERRRRAERELARNAPPEVTGT